MNRVKNDSEVFRKSAVLHRTSKAWASNPTPTLTRGHLCVPTSQPSPHTPGRLAEFPTYFPQSIHSSFLENVLMAKVVSLPHPALAHFPKGPKGMFVTTCPTAWTSENLLPWMNTVLPSPIRLATSGLLAQTTCLELTCGSPRFPCSSSVGFVLGLKPEQQRIGPWQPRPKA